jgi:hypothetical protein
MLLMVNPVFQGQFIDFYLNCPTNLAFGSKKMGFGWKMSRTIIPGSVCN